MTSGPVFRSLMNERSILIVSNGYSRKNRSDDVPVPKSSIARLTPRRRNSRISSKDASGLRMTSRSVTSSCRQCAGRPTLSRVETS